MTDARNLIGWVLLGGVAAIAGGAAALGVLQAPNNASMVDAATNTLAAPNYTQNLVQTMGGQKQTEFFVFQHGRAGRVRGKVVRTPDRLGGYIQSGGNRSYVYVIGTTGYQSVTAPAGVPVNRLTFYRQNSQPAIAYDPAHGYLPYATEAKHPGQSGSTYAFSLTKQGQTGHFTFTVAGPYVSRFTLTVPNASVRLDISDVGTSPPVQLPAGIRVVSPSGSGSGSSGTSSG